MSLKALSAAVVTMAEALEIYAATLSITYEKQGPDGSEVKSPFVFKAKMGVLCAVDPDPEKAVRQVLIGLRGMAVSRSATLDKALDASDASLNVPFGEPPQ